MKYLFFCLIVSLSSPVSSVDSFMTSEEGRYLIRSDSYDITDESSIERFYPYVFYNKSIRKEGLPFRKKFVFRNISAAEYVALNPEDLVVLRNIVFCYLCFIKEDQIEVLKKYSASAMLGVTDGMIKKCFDEFHFFKSKKFHYFFFNQSVKKDIEEDSKGKLILKEEVIRPVKISFPSLIFIFVFILFILIRNRLSNGLRRGLNFIFILYLIWVVITHGIQGGSEFFVFLFIVTMLVILLFKCSKKKRCSFRTYGTLYKPIIFRYKK